MMMIDEKAVKSSQFRKRMRCNKTHPNKHMNRFAFRAVSLIALIVVVGLINLSKSILNDEVEQSHRQLDDKPTRAWYQVIGYIFGVLYMFLGLAFVCDEFFVPALEEMSDRNNLSMDIAGATLMAAGGSAPELFTNIIGTFEESDVGFGTIVGSAVFNVLFVIGTCSLCSKEPLTLTWWPLLRDSVYYIIGLLVILIFLTVTSPGIIEWWESLILLVLYVGYVTVMYFNKKLESMIKGNNHQNADGLDDEAGLTSESGTDSSRSVHFLWPSGFRAGMVDLIVKPYMVKDVAGVNLVGKIKGDVNDVFRQVDEDNSGTVSKQELKSVLNDLNLDLSNDEFSKLFEELDTSQDGNIDKAEFTKWYMGSQDRMLLAVKETFENLDKNNSNTLDRDEIKELLLSISPYVGEDDITDALAGMYKSGDKNEITYAEFEKWYKDSVVFEKQLEAEAEQAEGMWAKLKPPKEATYMQLLRYIFVLPMTSILTLTIPDVRIPGYGKWCYLSFTLSILWIAVFSVLLVPWITLLGSLVGISDFLMGITFIAAGTSIPDLLSSVAVARMGQGDMAVSSSIGSNIFDILVGLPLPWIAFSIIIGKNVEVGAKSATVDIPILISMIFIIGATIHFSGWKLNKVTGGMMFVFYIAFLLQAILRQYL